jgi:pimeloyl-ACP methyl ester carboxylesterase
MEAIEPQRKALIVNGLRLQYLDWGIPGHRPLLLLHGFLGHAHVWDPLAVALRSRYRVLALDQRGHGRSQHSPELAYSIDDHLADITAFAAALRLRDPILVGHSMGGRNALFFAACNPESVQKIVVVDARPGNDLRSRAALMELLARFPLQARSLSEVAQAVRSLYPYLSPSFCEHIARFGYKRRSDGALVPCFDVQMASLSERSGGTAEDLWDFLGNVKCPTLIVRGKESPFLSREDVRRMCRQIPLATWQEVENATHMPAQENPEVFIEILKAFLGD